MSWLLNGHGANGPYAIYMLHGDGRSPVAQRSRLIDPTAEMRGVYWPSGVEAVQTVRHIYAQELGIDGIERLALYRMVGAEAVRHGVVLAPGAGETVIGSASVAFDPSAARPWRMLYAARTSGTGRPNLIRCAESDDGVVWNRIGTIYTADHQHEAAGIQIDHWAWDGETLRVFYTALESTARIHAAEARGTQWGGQLIRHGTIMSPAGVIRTVTGSVSPESRWLTVDDVEGLEAGLIYVLGREDEPNRHARVHIERVYADGRNVLLSDAPPITGTGLQLRSVCLNKISPSFVGRDANGIERGLFTSFGAFTTGSCEYVFPVVRQGEVFVQEPTPNPPFKPYGPGTRLSFENPTRLRQGCGFDWPEDLVV